MRYRRVTLAMFTMGTYGHTRGLHFNADGTGRETIDDGCCHRVADLDLRLTAPRKSSYGAAATVTLTHIRRIDRTSESAERDR